MSGRAPARQEQDPELKVQHCQKKKKNLPSERSKVILVMGRIKSHSFCLQPYRYFCLHSKVWLSNDEGKSLGLPVSLALSPFVKHEKVPSLAKPVFEC